MGMDIELAILFTDVVDSVRLYERLGDLPARDKIRSCLNAMRTAIEQHGGTLINTMGDGVMASFTDASDAVKAAAQMQQQIGSQPLLKVDGQPMAVRIGFHAGPVVLQKGDVNGTTVNVAARVMGEAKGGQILTTAGTASRLPYEWSTREIGLVELKGVANAVELFEVLWKEEDLTSVVKVLPENGGPPPGRFQLRLWMAGQEFLIDGNTRVVSIGRDEQNDCVVQGQTISRWHARIEINRNKFVLTDKSTNGTFVQMVDGKEDFIWRDSLPLNGEGLIGLGKLPEQDSPQTIRFVCEYCDTGMTQLAPG
jgi:class 3 adenylate cyclase